MKFFESSSYTNLNFTTNMKGHKQVPSGKLYDTALNFDINISPFTLKIALNRHFLEWIYKYRATKEFSKKHGLNDG